MAVIAKVFNQLESSPIVFRSQISRLLYAIAAAIKALKITHKSFCQWATREWLIIFTQKNPKTGKLRVYVTKDSVKTALLMSCKHRGKVIEFRPPECGVLLGRMPAQGHFRELQEEKAEGESLA